MPLTLDYLPQIEHHATFSANSEESLQIRGNRFDATTVHLGELAFGAMRYPLRQRLTGQYNPASCELIIEGFGSGFTGRGDTLNEAVDDFRLNVHQRFQELMHRRPFEMNSQDSSDWAILRRMIDETAFLNSLPVQMRQFGEIQFMKRSRPYAIRWDNGDVDVVDPNVVHSTEFLTFKHGQPVEAIVERDRLTDAIVQIPFITRVRSLRSREDVERNINQSIGSSLDYPEADWD